MMVASYYRNVATNIGQNLDKQHSLGSMQWLSPMRNFSKDSSSGQSLFFTKRCVLVYMWFSTRMQELMQTQKTHAVTQFHITSWLPDGHCSNMRSVVDVIEEMTKVQMRTSNGPIFVHCRYQLCFSDLGVIYLWYYLAQNPDHYSRKGNNKMWVWLWVCTHCLVNHAHYFQVLL